MEETREIPDVENCECDFCYAMKEDIDLWLLKGWYVQEAEKNLPPGHVLVGKKPGGDIDL